MSHASFRQLASSLLLLAASLIVVPQAAAQTPNPPAFPGAQGGGGGAPRGPRGPLWGEKKKEQYWAKNKRVFFYFWLWCGFGGWLVVGARKRPTRGGGHFPSKNTPYLFAPNNGPFFLIPNGARRAPLGPPHRRLGRQEKPVG
jgi:hypothetical protein